MDMNNVVSNVIAQAKYYLEEAGEYYPFGAVVNNRDELKPLSILLDDEHPKSSEVLDKLTEGLSSGIKSKEYKYGAIGVDVLVIEKDTSDKIDALEVRLFDGSSTIEKSYFAYKKTNNIFEFRKIEV